MQAPQWLQSLDKREYALVSLSLVYATDHSAAGIPAHGLYMLIAKLARLLDKQERAR